MAKHHFTRVLITGTTSGLGRSFHRYYASEEVEIIEVNRRAVQSDPELPVLHSEVLDITSSGEVFTFLMHLKKNQILPDLFLLNAGINLPDCINGLDFAHLTKVMNVNLTVVLTFLSAIHRLGLTDRTIATISSTSNIVPNSANIGYHLSKLNLKQLTLLLASRDANNTYKTVVLSPVHTNIQTTSPTEPGLSNFFFNLLAVDSLKAARACAKFFERSGTVLYFTKPACAFYFFVRFILFLFPFLYKGTRTAGLSKPTLLRET